MTGLVTVVVPVYDVAAYLPECLDSIAAQTVFDRMEVVVVDDGSTDASGEIADAFADRHPGKVRVIHQGNRGLGAARNRGLDAAGTPYVTFCDSDDLLPEDAVESLLTALEHHPEADLAVGRIETFPKPTTWPWLRHLTGEGVEVVALEDAPDLVHGPSACNKLFRTHPLRAAGVRFGEGVHFEDVPFTLPVLLRSTAVALVPTVVYRYRKRDTGTSIMDSVWARVDNYLDHVTVNAALREALPELPPERRFLFDVFLARSLQGFLWRAPDVFEGPALQRYFDRARDLVGHLGDEALLEGCRDLRHRLPYLALRAGSLEAFRDVLGTVVDLDANDGTAVVVLDERMGSCSSEVRAVRKLTAHLETVDRLPGGRGVRLTGSFAADGLVPRSLSPGRVALRVRGSGVTQPVTTVARQRTVRHHTELLCGGFVVDVASRRLRPGAHNLRLVVLGEHGQASRTLQPTVGLQRSARRVPLSGRRVVVHRDRWGNAVLECAPAASGRARTRARLSSVAAEVGAFLRRRPMAGWVLLRTLTRPVVRRRRIWLVGERTDTAQDNGAALFRHLRSHRPDIHAYYVIERRAPQAGRLSGVGHVVGRGSLRHRFLMLHAEWLASAYDFDAYLLPPSWNRADYLSEIAWRVGSRRAFLQHGVIYNDVRRALRRPVTGLSLFVTSSTREAEYLRATTAYGDELAVTGLPRFDELTARRQERYVLLMPTWRVQFGRPSYQAATADDGGGFGLAGSDYERFLRQLLTDPRLHRTLEAHGVELRVLPHYEIARLLAPLVAEVDSVRFLDQSTVDIQAQIRGASLLVTDWSSVFFDAALLGTPVVLTPFDEDDLDARPYGPGYFDLRRDGFGPVAPSVEEAVAATCRYVESGFTREVHYDRRVEEFFAAMPDGHCEAVAAAMDARTGWPDRLPAIEEYGDRR